MRVDRTGTLDFWAPSDCQTCHVSRQVTAGVHHPNLETFSWQLRRVNDQFRSTDHTPCRLWRTVPYQVVVTADQVSSALEFSSSLQLVYRFWRTNTVSALRANSAVYILRPLTRWVFSLLQVKLSLINPLHTTGVGLPPICKNRTALILYDNLGEF